MFIMKMTPKHIAFMAMAFLALSSCERKGVQEEDYGTAISFALDMERTDTKVTMFDEDGCLTDTGKGGGNFRLNAYFSDTDQVVIDNARVSYTNWAGVWGWWFRDERETPGYEYDDVLVNYYWPFGYNLDFFGYMPKDLDGTNVTIGDYSAEKGPSFSCDLPLDNSGQDGLQEFIYAYTEDYNKERESGSVSLQFKHPFACVVFRLGESHRIKINGIQLTGLYSTGTFNPTDGWTGSGERNKTLDISVDKTVPDQINYNSLIGGPYIVMPQDFSAGTEELVFNYDYQEETDLSGKVPIKALSAKWEPGKKYIYTIHRGDHGEEVVFKVQIEEWNVIGYINEVEVL